MYARSSVALTAAILLAWAATANAQDLSKADAEKARQHYTNAQAAMQQGDFEFAAQQFAVAYDYTKDPVLFYSIASANDQAGDCEAAVVYYGRYIREAAPADDAPAATKTQYEQYRQLAEQRLAACQATAGAASATAQEPSAETPTSAGVTEPSAETPAPAASSAATAGPAAPAAALAPAPSWQRSAGWIAVGGTVAFATVGAVLGLSAASRADDVENLLTFREVDGQPARYDGTTRERYEDLVDEGERFETYAAVAFGLAGAAAVSATVFFLLDSSHESGEVAPQRTVTPTVSNRSVGLSTRWQF